MTKPDGPDQSPDYLSPKRGLNVRRLNRMPLAIAAGMVILVIGAIGYTYQAKTASAAIDGNTKADRQAEPANAAAILEKAPVAGEITQTAPLLPPPTTEPIAQPASAAAPEPPLNPYEEAQARLWEQQQQQANQVQDTYRSNWQNALGASTTVFSGKSAQTPELTASVTKHQGEIETLNNSHYLLATRVQALSPYEVKAGTVIPSVMISGINSELPGQLMAQVSENVFDTATGQLLLIPQGSRLVGSYENNTVVGQHRVLIAWNRIIYPDASSLDLGAMAGADQSGYAGLQDKTNNHSWPTFRNALLLSAITAGVQLSQPQARRGDSAYSGQQVIAGSLGMQMGQLGMGSIQRGMNLPPTLTIRPGYRFNVMVSKDLILPPWRG
jgi:type IV secretory pathway VirB10-like protein